MIKKTAYILTLLLTSLTFGQSPIIDLLDDDGNKIAWNCKQKKDKIICIIKPPF